MPLAEVQPGMLLRLTTGDRVPVDGEITQGEAWLDEAMLTGEPIRSKKAKAIASMPGQWYRTAVCCFVPVRLAAIPRYQGSFAWCARPGSKPEIGQLADKISAVFVPVVVVIALVSAAIWYFFVRHRRLSIPWYCHYGADYRLPVCAGTGDADVDYFRRRAGG